MIYYKSHYILSDAQEIIEELKMVLPQLQETQNNLTNILPELESTAKFLSGLCATQKNLNIYVINNDNDNNIINNESNSAYGPASTAKLSE